MKRNLFILIFIVLGISVLWLFRRAEQPIPMRVKVLSAFPHDGEAFTQGFIYYHGSIYESTGLLRRSSLRKLDRRGNVTQRVDLPVDVFGEGLERVNNRLVVLTWKQHVALVFDLDTFTRQKEFKYEGEGWGLCFDGKSLIMSDGSDKLIYRDPETFQVLRTINVKLSGEKLARLNELEWAKGAIYANIWRTDRIVRIDPRTGKVTALIDASGLLTVEERAHADVLNGIAYKPDSDTFLITGKFWPAIFETKFVALHSES